MHRKICAIWITFGLLASVWSIAFDLQIILLAVFRGTVNKNAY